MSEHPSQTDSEEGCLLPNFAGPPVLKDKWNFVYLTIFFTGCGTLIPWNFFVTATSYFQYKLRNVSTSDPDTIRMAGLFENYLAICSMGPGLFFVFLNIFLIRCARANVRFAFGILLMLLGFTVTLIMVPINMDSKQADFFYITLTTVVIMNVGGAFVQSSLFGTIAMLPQRNMKAAMEGQAVGGILAALANIITITLSSGPETSAMAYFIIAISFIFASATLFLMLPKIKYSRYYLERKIVTLAPPESSDPLLNSISVNDIDDMEDLVDEATVKSNADTRFRPNRYSDNEDYASRSLATTITRSQEPTFIDLLSRLWLPALSVYLVFLTTLTLFPAIFARVRSSIYVEDMGTTLWAWTNTYFIPVICFLSFNMCDWLGRTIGGTFKWPSSHRMYLVLIVAIVRISLIPFAMYTNVQPRYHLSVLLLNDAWPIILVIVIGFTNGYLGTICMINGPGFAGKGNEETAGIIMNFFLMFGITSGCGISFLIAKLI